MNIDFNHSNQIHAIKFPRTAFVIAQAIFLLISLIFFIFFLAPRNNLAEVDFQPQQLLGIAIINLIGALLVNHILLFNRFKLKHLNRPLIFDPEKSNLIDFFSYDSAIALWRAINHSTKNKKMVSAASLAYELINSYQTKFIFDHLGLDYELVKRHLASAKPQELIGQTLYTEHFIATMNDVSRLIASGHTIIKPEDLLIIILKNDSVLRTLLPKLKVSVDDFIETIKWFRFSNKTKKIIYFFDPLSLMKYRGVGKDWAYGYTPTLDKYSLDMTKHAQYEEFDYKIMSHNQALQSMERILARRGENNIILVGEPGTGRRTTILKFIYKITHGMTYENLSYKRVVEIDINALASVNQSNLELNNNLNEILGEALLAGNVIVIIDDLHNFLTDNLNITNTLIPYLKSERFQFIGVTDHGNYHQRIEFDPSLKVLMEKVEIDEPSTEQTISILEDILIKLENEYKIMVTFQALKAIVVLTKRYEPGQPFPEKAINLLNEILTQASGQGLKIITADFVSDLLSQKLGVEIGAVQEEEREKLLNLEKLLHQKVIGQDRAISVITKALQKSRVGLTKEKPLGTFLFLGPTGVGKTQTAKTLAEIYFKDSSMIRLDLSEYQEPDSIKRLLGSAHDQIKGQFLNKLREKPFSVVLLDELEKAHPNINNLFLQVLDEGYLTDDYGEKTSFLNSIIIATSNAGSEFIREKIKEGIDEKELESNLIEFVLKNHIFSPEFINRFDAVVVFTPLTKEDLFKVARIELGELNKKLKEKQLEIQITDELLARLAELGFDPVFGARALKRTINEKIEDLITQGILENKYRSGEKIIINPMRL